MKKAYDVKKSLLLALPLLFVRVAHAQALQLDAGEPCSEIIINLSSNDRYIQQIAIFNFVSGYITGSNTANAMNHDLSKIVGSGLKSDFILEYARDFCLHNPNNYMLGMTMRLMNDLKKK
ncbi:hypothetical protein [Gluconobacter sp. OJB]|uniref:hypothetical protein n=1 Tax=Gluconobacter sp. OJB TaxID=3145196 RepID=UPI0031F744EF